MTIPLWSDWTKNLFHVWPWIQRGKDDGVWGPRVKVQYHTKEIASAGWRRSHSVKVLRLKLDRESRSTAHPLTKQSNDWQMRTNCSRNLIESPSLCGCILIAPFYRNDPHLEMVIMAITFVVTTKLLARRDEKTIMEMQMHSSVHAKLTLCCLGRVDWMGRRMRLRTNCSWQGRQRFVQCHVSLGD